MFDYDLTNTEKIECANVMLKSQGFDQFLANKFTTIKRYGGEGAESAMCFYNELFRIAAQSNFMFINEIDMCSSMQMPIFFYFM